MSMLRSITVVAILLASALHAHPGELHDEAKVKRDLRVRDLMAADQLQQYSQCEDSEHVREYKREALQRRFATFQRLRQERGLEDDDPTIERRTAQQFAGYNRLSHDRTSTLKYNLTTAEEVVFGSNVSCILTPDNANGPYWVYQEKIRSNVVEGQPGVPMHLEMQFIDTTTCKPLPNILIDIWSCNATGAYSGVSAAGEGGLQTTFLRGVQQTNSFGVVTFDTIFPGHYSGRATHEHIVTHTGSTLLPNGTYTGGHVSHLSQIFFDQDLINKVEATAPYNANRIPQTSNTADMFTGYSATAQIDPFANYVQLGSQLSLGIFAWIEIGINPSNNWDQYAQYASVWSEKGGYNNPNMNMGVVGNAPPTHG